MNRLATVRQHQSSTPAITATTHQYHTSVCRRVSANITHQLMDSNVLMAAILTFTSNLNTLPNNTPRRAAIVHSQRASGRQGFLCYGQARHWN